MHFCVAVPPNVPRPLRNSSRVAKEIHPLDIPATPEVQPSHDQGGVVGWRQNTTAASSGSGKRCHTPSHHHGSR